MNYGAHAILYSADADATRATLAKVLAELSAPPSGDKPWHSGRTGHERRPGFPGRPPGPDGPGQSGLRLEVTPTA